MARLRSLIPNLFEFTLNNINFVPGVDERGRSWTSQELLEEVLDIAAASGDKIIKLKVSKINLRGGMAMKLITEVLFTARNMILLDISWAKLMPKELAALTKALAGNCRSMRNLNLSYNRLNFDGADKTQVAYSEAFLSHLEEWIDIARFVNHVNFSGMNLKAAQLSRIIQLLKRCQFLLGFHLSDNDITKCKWNSKINDHDYEETFYECTEEFGLTEEDLIAVNRSKNAAAQEMHLVANRNKAIREYVQIDYEKVLRPYFNQAKPEEKLKAAKRSPDPITCRKVFKDHLLLGKESRVIDKFKVINRA